MCWCGCRRTADLCWRLKAPCTAFPVPQLQATLAQVHRYHLPCLSASYLALMTAASCAVKTAFAVWAQMIGICHLPCLPCLLCITISTSNLLLISTEHSCCAAKTADAVWAQVSCYAFHASHLYQHQQYSQSFNGGRITWADFTSHACHASCVSPLAHECHSASDLHTIWVQITSHAFANIRACCLSHLERGATM